MLNNNYDSACVLCNCLLVGLTLLLWSLMIKCKLLYLTWQHCEHW